MRARNLDNAYHAVADLFDDPPQVVTRSGQSIVPPVPEPTRAEAACAARDEGIARAGAHADRASRGWIADALERFKVYSYTHQYFTTEAVRESFPAFTRPPDARAWGAVAARAVRAGLVVRDGYETAKSPTVHRMIVTRWRSLSFDV